MAGESWAYLVAAAMLTNPGAVIGVIAPTFIDSFVAGSFSLASAAVFSSLELAGLTVALLLSPLLLGRFDRRHLAWLAVGVALIGQLSSLFVRDVGLLGALRALAGTGRRGAVRRCDPIAGRQQPAGPCVRGRRHLQSAGGYSLVVRDRPNRRRFSDTGCHHRVTHLPAAHRGLRAGVGAGQCAPRFVTGSSPPPPAARGSSSRLRLGCWRRSCCRGVSARYGQ